MGRHEPLDVDAAVKAAPPGLPVVTVGVSLGATVVLIHAGAFGGVAGTVAISAPSAWSVGCRVGFTRVQRWIGARPGRLVMAALMRTRVRMEREGLPDASTSVPPAPPVFTIVVHDPEDSYFAPEHAERIYQWAAEPKELWWCPGQGHGSDLLTPTFAERLSTELVGRLSDGGDHAGPVSTP